MQRDEARTTIIMGEVTNSVRVCQAHTRIPAARRETSSVVTAGATELVLLWSKIFAFHSDRGGSPMNMI